MSSKKKVKKTSDLDAVPAPVAARALGSKVAGLGPVVHLQPAERQLSQIEIDGANRFALFEMARRLRQYAERENISKLKVTVEEFRPIQPVYPQEGGDHIGYVQKGPRKLVITIEDFEHDGHIRAAGEPW